MHLAGDILRRYWSDPENLRKLRLAGLWRFWPQMVGPELAELAKPVGHSRTTLLLGVEDPMAMQEVSYDAPAILRAVNASLGEAYFDRIRFDLIGDHIALDAVAGSFPQAGKAESTRTVPGPRGLGGLPVGFSGIPSLERCYRAYVRLYGKPGGE